MSTLIGVLGFTEVLRPKDITFSLWEFFKKLFIFTLFKFMAFSASPETETARLQENPTRMPDISEESAAARAGSRELSGSCSICLCEYLGGEEMTCLRTCEHVFHRRCLDRWMNCNRWTCPLCRTPILPTHLLPVPELERRPSDIFNFVASC